MTNRVPCAKCGHLNGPHRRTCKACHASLSDEQTTSDSTQKMVEKVMRCPNCGTPEQARVKTCTSCGEAFASQDLLELHQLEFLLAETATWGVIETVRTPYVAKLEALRERLLRRAPPEPEPVEVSTPVAPPEPVVAEPALEVEAVIAKPEPVAAKPEPAVPMKPVPKPAPPREKVPFDQWLLSERNIKLALYSGGLLLVLAGLIFIGVNWARIPGPVKFAITMMVTGLMYLGGYLLFQRPMLRIGGIALLGVASGFLTLNFAVLQIYVLGPGGLRDDVMWLIASPLCLLLYMLTAYWTRGDLFSYISLAAVASAVTAALVVTGAPLMAYTLVYSLVVIAILILARTLKSSRLADFTHKPLLLVSQSAMPLVLIASLIGWITQTGCIRNCEGSPWLPLLAMGVGVLFYVLTDITYNWRVVRWAAVILFSVTFALILVEANFSDTATGLALMILSLAQLSGGYMLERRGEARKGALPLYATAYVLALLVTSQALTDTDALIKVLFGDVVLLGVSAAVYRNYRWVYGAVWLFMLPIYLIVNLSVSALYYQGLLLGVLGLNYMAAGYALGRRELRLGGPFLTAAAFLSVVVVVFSWGSPVVATLVLAGVALLYLLTALWLDWTWLQYPMLVAVNLAVLAANRMAFDSFDAIYRPLIISYAALGVALAVSGLVLRRNRADHWAWPVYIVAIVDLGGSYGAGLFAGSWLAFGLSAVMALLLLSYAWLEKGFFSIRRIPSPLTYLGAGSIFLGHFYLLGAPGGYRALDYWPITAAGLCAVFLLLAWLLPRRQLTEIYGKPLRYSGLVLMAIPLVGSFFHETVVITVAFGIAGATLTGEAIRRRVLTFAYISAGAFAVLSWAILVSADPGVSSIVFVAVAALYLFAANRFGRARLLLPVLLAIDLAALTLNDLFFESYTTLTHALIIAYTALGAVMTLIGLWLRRSVWSRWAWPLYVIGALSQAGAYVVGLFVGGWLAVGLSAVLALFLLTFAWLERAELAKRKLPPALTYLGNGALFIGHFYLLNAIGGSRALDSWPGFAAGLCAAFVALAWMVRHEALVEIYSKPLRRVGLWLMAAPLIGSLLIWFVFDGPLLLAVTFLIAGITYAADAALSRNVSVAYLSVGSFVVVIWGVLMVLEVSELQAYVIPPGLVLVVAGWYERLRGRYVTYRLLTLFGLMTLLGSAFVQSLPRGGIAYALILAVECLVSIGWGIRTHSRGYVQLGSLALFATAIVQLGPGFVELPRWIQIGATGALLLGGGLVALFKREEILATRQRLTDEWRQWEP